MIRDNCANLYFKVDFILVFKVLEQWVFLSREYPSQVIDRPIYSQEMRQWYDFILY